MAETGSALEGVRVLEMANYQMGPASTVMLADLGADVIKVEDPAGGDFSRGMVKLLSQTTGLTSDRNFFFESINRNKRSLTLNLKTEQGREILGRLVERSDALVSNLRFGVAERLGADYDSLASRNPRLVYAHASGYGPNGPDAEKTSLDPLGLARSGMMLALTPDGLEPQWPTGAIADQIGAILLSYAVLAGLVHVQVTGRGQKVSTSLLGSAIWLGQLNANAALMVGQEQPKFVRSRTSNPVYNTYECADGRWLFFGLFQSDRFWAEFCEAAGVPDLSRDERFDTAAKREERCEELIALLDVVFRERPSQEWVERFSRHPDLVWDVVQPMTELQHDPQVRANDYVIDYEHPELGDVKMMGFPVTFHETPAAMRMPAPALGQHTEEILLEVGYDWDEIIRFRDEGVI